MNPEEYQKLADIENRHWFYVGKRIIVRHWINRCRPLRPDDLLADCGAGTGTFAAEMTSQCKVVAVDDHQESLVLAREKLGADRVREGSCTRLPFADGIVDVVTALDVIEHVEDDRRAINEFWRVLKPGGIAVITVPALPALWSDWDVVLHHFRRYTRSSLRSTLGAADFELLHINYINVAVLPIVYGVRKWRAVKQWIGRPADARSEDAIPPDFLNRILRDVFVRSACQAGIQFPAGVGLLAVVRKRK